MSSELFKIEDKEWDKNFDGFLQFLATISRHDDHRVAIHIPSKLWMFYRFNEMDVDRPKIWLRDFAGNYFLKSVFGNLSLIKSKDAGRLTIESDKIPFQLIGKVVEVTIRYRKTKYLGKSSIHRHKVEAISMTRKID